MKVKESEYLKAKKPILQKLLSKLLAKYEYASILANDSKSTNYSVSKAGTSIYEDGTLSERGFCVKVYDNGKAAEYSFNAIEEDTIGEVFGEITERLDALGKTLPEGVTAFRFDGEKVTPVTGGSINGSIIDSQTNMHFSKEIQKSANFVGPYAMCFEDVSVAGV
ncbi:MAG: hypothetical protein IKH28_12480 [Lachnospiraceae bacterium]|nr:hypothetical protein [Lachnospiraceae bacterium]